VSTQNRKCSTIEISITPIVVAAIAVVAVDPVVGWRCISVGDKKVDKTNASGESVFGTPQKGERFVPAKTILYDIPTTYSFNLESSPGVYSGETVDGIPQGRGRTTRFVGGNKTTIAHIGEYVDGLFHGRGKLYNVKGRVAVDGYFINGLREGEGISYRFNGTRIYSGDWVKSKEHGFGKQFDCKGKKVVYAGEWFCGAKWIFEDLKLE